MITLSPAATATNHNIYKQYVTSEFTNLSNHSCQVRFKGDKKPSAKEVYHYLYSLPATWNISVENVARHFDVREKYIQEIFAIIIANDHMLAIRERHSNGRLGKIIYKVFPPQVEKRPVDANNIKQPELKEKCEKQPQVEKRPVDTHIIQNKDLKKTITAPPPEPPPEPDPPEKPSCGAAAAVENFRKQLPPEINFRINNAAIAKIVGIRDDHIKWAAREAMQSRYTEIKRKIGLFISLCKQEMPPAQPPAPEPDHCYECVPKKGVKTMTLAPEFNFDGLEDQINDSCNKLKELSIKTGIKFWPLAIARSKIQAGTPAKIVLNALISTINNWDDISYYPKDFFEKQCDKGDWID